MTAHIEPVIKMADDIAKKLAAGMKAMEEGDFKKAYSAYKKICAENPNDAECWYYKAECGNYASGMGEAKVKDEEIIEAYEKAIELDAKCEYYESYGLFLISINKFDDAEKIFCEAAEADESRSASLYSEFAVEYFNQVTALYDEIIERQPEAKEKFEKKALEYLLKAIDVTPEEAKKLL